MNIIEFKLPHEKPPHSRGSIRFAAQLSQTDTRWSEVDRKTRKQETACKSWWTLGAAYMAEWIKVHGKDSHAA